MKRRQKLRKKKRSSKILKANQKIERERERKKS